MSGTVKTDSALLAEFADGQADGAITPSDVRDLIVSETAHITAAIQAAIPAATTSQLYAGSGSSGVAIAVSLGSNLSMSGTTLNASGGGGGSSVTPTAVSAAGTSVGTATVVSTSYNVITSASSGQGLIAPVGYSKFWNATTVPVLIYPVSGAVFDVAPDGEPAEIQPGGAAEFMYTSSTQGFVR